MFSSFDGEDILALFPNTSLFDLFLGIFACSLMLYNTQEQGSHSLLVL